MASLRTGVPLINGVLLTTSQASLYECPASLVSVAFMSARMLNTGAGEVTVDLWVTFPGDDETLAKFKFYQNFGVGVDVTKILTPIIGYAIPAGGAIWGKCSAISSVSVSLTGLEKIS